VRGTVTTGGARILSPEPAAADAPAIAVIRQHGCMVVGKTNMHEWAVGDTCDNPYYGTIRNPRDPLRIPGGSSGGSAVAVAAGMCDWAIGSDTGGSIRIPAGLCSIVGVKPTTGLVSTERTLPLSFTLDTLGPMAPDVLSAARALHMMTGRTFPVAPEGPAPDGLRLAVPDGWVVGLDQQTQTVWEHVAAGLTRIPFPDRLRMQRVCLTIMRFEGAAYHAQRVKENPGQYGGDILAWLQVASRTSRAEYIAAMSDRDGLRHEVEQAMAGWDALLLPATGCVAPMIGQAEIAEPLTRFTRPFNVTGHPVVTLPAPSEGLPVGVQVVGSLGDDARVLAVARALERTWGHG